MAGVFSSVLIVGSLVSALFVMELRKWVTPLDVHSGSARFFFAHHDADVLRYGGLPWVHSSDKPWRFMQTASLLPALLMNLERNSVPLFSARDAGAYGDTGFAVVRMDVTGVPTTEEFERAVRALHPDATKVVFTANIVRGFGSNVVGVPAGHLDFFPNRSKRRRYSSWDWVDEHDAGGSRWAVLGLWKPVNMTSPICDKPLAFADARSVDIKDVVPMEQDLFLKDEKGGEINKKNLAGVVRKNGAQRWHYVPDMTNEELLVFTHTTSDRFHANPHVGVSFSGCSADRDSRKSVETRALVFFGGPEADRSNIF